MAILQQVNQGSVHNLHCVYAGVVAEQEVPSRYLTAEAPFVKLRVQLDCSAAPAPNLKTIVARRHLIGGESAILVGGANPCGFA